MPVKLISYSMPVAELNHLDDMDALIAYCARVSNPSNQLSEERNDAKLISYLVRNKHWSPFEMANVCVEIKTSRDIARQILRHRSFSFQEFSQRYAEVINPPVLKEARLQDSKNRQNSIETKDDDLQKWWIEKQVAVFEEANRLYKTALDLGVAKEVARSVLPEGLTESTILMNGSVRSWIHYIQLRSGNGTQKEHRQIALDCAEAIAEVFPSITNFVERD